MNIEEQYKAKMRSLKPQTQKAIKIGLNVLMIGVLLLGANTIYINGKTNGKIELCKDANLILVNFRGVEQCMNEEVYKQTKLNTQLGRFDQDAFNTYSEGINGLQYNIT